MKKKINYKWIIGGCLVLILVAIGVVLAFELAKGTETIEVCTKCKYSDGDVCECVETEKVEIIKGSENDGDCSGGGEPVYDEVGGFVGVAFRGCKK